MPTIRTIPTAIDGCNVELQSLIGTLDGGVLHMLPGGTNNPESFAGQIGDAYAFTAVGKNTFRGGHYHHRLQEFFFQVSGTSLWLLSDFRENSPTNGTTIGIILGITPVTDTKGHDQYTLTDGSLPRIRIPAGVYHAIFPLTDERMLVTALGSIGYDKTDYAYPTINEVPGAQTILDSFGVKAPTN